ncbi:hypothetical protein [Stenotrophomonas sp. AB1(2024)]|uniref:hypothetical protein n=1 Tax=Stenotrophomonas sp. AB1(2024) TaxID=3132215 RepID=UPI0030A50848
MLKSQDVVLLLRLISLWRLDGSAHLPLRTDNWQGWEHATHEDWHWDQRRPGFENHWRGLFTVRQLAGDTGISKSQVSLSLNRCFDNGLAFPDRKTDLPKANAPAVLGLLVHAARFLFPVVAGPVSRGIPTAMSAPVLQDHLSAGAGQILVWPSETGNSQGKAIEPLTPTVPYAVRTDPLLYAMLALTDSLRAGLPRERAVAESQLATIMNLPERARQ